MRRCDWATNELAIRYHDEEWGVPVHDDRRWFEFLILEGAQAGLSWDTILKKRENYRAVFDDFDPALVACYEEKKIDALLADPGVIRNRLKIHSAIKNARAFLEVQQEFASFDSFIWGFVGGAPVTNTWRTRQEVPARSDVSDALSKALKRRGFTFVGSTICYALMQATGLTNDHLVDCFRHAQVG
ncbi:DNA-3-methyladenine glycosylase I [Singulisphaera acidiphila]|uniref:DNA-3-methyladenine glycosylase I n=1 Tax=Singulisphaera acidiphila (strain ATCC BAA-1392 / DSM 18658 / VKM B-2454 / MOB10) TaxID=886293 RepID=L0DKI5_SINAD|nr:DNA-3-methyladenine glycosylase I [Singulisphaera acidiphila]AGA29869.1 3-methyladenine DNA glycosylase [Singulisphaera acidiphila DSM 18658]